MHKKVAKQVFKFLTPVGPPWVLLNPKRFVENPSMFFEDPGRFVEDSVGLLSHSLTERNFIKKNEMNNLIDSFLFSFC